MKILRKVIFFEFQNSFIEGRDGEKKVLGDVVQYIRVAPLCLWVVEPVYVSLTCSLVSIHFKWNVPGYINNE